MSACQGSISMRSLTEEILENQTVRFSIDLVSASRRNLGFLRLVHDSDWLHHESTILAAIRRYDQVWMPLIADLTTKEGSNNSKKPPMIVPPLDVEWVWFCHSLFPANYREYCESRFSKLIGKPIIFDEENEEYALNKCIEIWGHKFPSEPFENEVNTNSDNYSSLFSEYLLDKVLKQRDLCRRFCEPYYSEMMYLVAAKQRYRGFLHMVHKFGNESAACNRLVPTSDVLLMWLTHLSYPTAYAVDVKELEADLEKIVGVWEEVNEEDIERTKMLWESIFDQPYEKAGGAAIARPITDGPPFYWDLSSNDVNTKYKSTAPRFLVEVCIFVKLSPNSKLDISKKEFLRLRMAKGHRELKMDKPIPNFTSKTWQKAWHIYCEFGTKGIILELRHRGGRCFKGNAIKDSVSFTWNDLLRAPSLTLGKEIDRSLRITASITPPVQASYLLKCVPDRVTDDSGAMISDVILRMNNYRPQEGRWLSRTVLDHSGRECFVVRMRIGGGFWRRGGEAPKSVKWDDRIIEIREGSWSYVTSSTSIGRFPDKVVGTASPKEPPEGCQASWSFSTGYDLFLQWDSSKSISELRFDMQHKDSSESTVKLLQGRQMQYEIRKSIAETKEGNEEVSNREEDEFVTVVRFSDENPNGKATALLNWKLLVVEVVPEEDVVLALLICVSILRSLTEMKREDIGNLLVRRRIREVRIGERDWGSVVLHPFSSNSTSSVSSSSPYLQPWYWNPKLAMESLQVKEPVASTPALSYSQGEGGDKLYKSAIIP